MQHQNLGVFFNAPSWNNKDFYAFLLLQRILGNFNSEMYSDVMHDV
jgi:predicted Zn-dependent peptidase